MKGRLLHNFKRSCRKESLKKKKISMACYNGRKCFAVPLSKIHVDKKTLFKKLLSKSFVSGNKTKKIYSLLLGLYVLKDTCRLTKQEQLYSSLVYNCDKLYLFWYINRFLFDNQSPEHIYYRWKLFSILQVCFFHY